MGPENFFLFGLTVDQVNDLWDRGYTPRQYYQENAPLQEAIDLLYSGRFSPEHQARFVPLLDNLLYHDPYMLFADYPSYIDCQDDVAAAYRDQERWTRMSIQNVARMGQFSSDRSIREYCRNIWGIRKEL